MVNRWFFVVFGMIIVVGVGIPWQAPASNSDTHDELKQNAQASPITSRLGTHVKPSQVGFIARFRGILGYGFLLFIAYLLSVKRKKIQVRTVLWGLGLQIILALIVLNPVISRFFFEVMDAGVRKLLGFSEYGINFLFSSVIPHKVTLIDSSGNEVTQIVKGYISPVIKNFAFYILPTVIFFSSLITLLYHLGVMQWIVKGLARAMVYMLKTSGAETLSCAANIFLGQTEAPLLVKPFVQKMTMSELMAVMVGGFATVSGGMLAIYVGMMRDLPGIAGHLVTVSFMAAPCALALAKIIYPETDTSDTGGKVQISVERLDNNVIEAAARGATDGMTLVLNIAAMLIAFVSIMAMLNALLGIVHLSIQQILGWLLSPLVWTMGIPWDEALKVGQLLGEKFVLTELIAFNNLQTMITSSPAVLSERSAIIASYALCGFANVASIGIQIGGIGGMAPSRRGDLAKLGLRAMLAGGLVSCISGTIAGMII